MEPGMSIGSPLYLIPEAILANSVILFFDCFVHPPLFLLLGTDDMDIFVPPHFTVGYHFGRVIGLFLKIPYIVSCWVKYFLFVASFTSGYRHDGF